MQEERDTRQAMLQSARKELGGKKAKKLGTGGREILNLELSEAIQLFNREEFPEAGARFTSILRLDPYNSVAKSYLEKIRRRSSEPSREADAHGDYLTGISQYYKGEYASAVASLTSAQTQFRNDPKLFAFLGAAQTQQFIEGGGSDSTLLSRARDAFAACQRLTPSFSPDARVFPQEVLDVFRSVRKERTR